MKPYEEVCFPSGIIRWVRENNLYVCRLTEDQMNEIKEIHETPYTKTYSGGKPNYTQPIERELIKDAIELKEAWDKGYQQGIQDERTSGANIGIAGFGAKVEPARQNPYIAEQRAMNEALRRMVKQDPILPGGGIGRHPDVPNNMPIANLKEDELMYPTHPEPTVDGWPLYSGLPPAKVQDERSFEEFAQGFAQSAQVIGIPKREWHELTDNEIATIKAKYGFGVNIFSFTSAVRELETWLKERNT